MFWCLFGCELDGRPPPEFFGSRCACVKMVSATSDLQENRMDIWSYFTHGDGIWLVLIDSWTVFLRIGQKVFFDERKHSAKKHEKLMINHGRIDDLCDVQVPH